MLFKDLWKEYIALCALLNYKLILAYDGSNYFGWQKTKEGPSIEAVLEKTLSQIVQTPISLQAASRTDRGVHANGQVVNFLTSKNLSTEKMFKSLNKILPKDIVVIQFSLASQDFHPTTQCKAKIYCYYVSFGSIQLPLYRSYAWHVPHKINIQLISEVKDLLIGTHDFRAFCNDKLNCHYEDYIRTIYSIDVKIESDERVVFRIHGNQFLYKMVRNIVGSLIDVSRGKLSPDLIKDCFKKGLRAELGVTAPAHGLFLDKVLY